VKVLGVETSCDETAVAVVEDGRTILSNVVASQIDVHRPYYGVVPEIASRKHTEAISHVCAAALEEAGVSKEELEGVGVSCRPGLVGSLLVGVCFGKSLAYGLGVPCVGVDHIEAHLYAAGIESSVDFPFVGLLVSGGHTLITVVRGYHTFDVLGSTVDDACGEAFDKVAKHYDLGYPGGKAIDDLAREGDAEAFDLPRPSLKKGEHRYDVSYSGLKTAVVNQLEQFRRAGRSAAPANIAASFQRAAIDMVVEKTLLACNDLAITTVVVGGGVAANSYLRKRLAAEEDLRAVFPPMALCTDNGAMIAARAYHLLRRGCWSDLALNAEARVPAFRRPFKPTVRR
jgi:N6-L-threonylcarbamoyladenine synthase